MGAKVATAVDANSSYENAYRRRLRYGFISGLIFLAVGAGFFIFGIMSLVVSTE
jgi:hypothetical protein